MDQVDLSVFAQRGNISALIDSDYKSDSIRKKFIENCGKHKIPVHKLERYSIENYFTLSALRDVFRSQIPQDVTELKPCVKIETQIGLNTKKSGKKIAQAMDIRDIKDTDLFSFLVSIGEAVEGKKHKTG